MKKASKLHDRHPTFPNAGGQARVSLQVKVRLAKKPKAMRLEPAGLNLKITWRDGVAAVTVPKVDVHEMVVVSE